MFAREGLPVGCGGQCYLPRGPSFPQTDRTGYVELGGKDWSQCQVRGSSRFAKEECWSQRRMEWGRWISSCDVSRRVLETLTCWQEVVDTSACPMDPTERIALGGCIAPSED